MDDIRNVSNTLQSWHVSRTKIKSDFAAHKLAKIVVKECHKYYRIFFKKNSLKKFFKKKI